MIAAALIITFAFAWILGITFGITFKKATIIFIEKETRGTTTIKDILDNDKQNQ